MLGEQTAAALIPVESPAEAGLPAGAAHPGASAAAELVTQVRAELPAMAGLPAREELLAAAWLMSLRSARTRRAYAGDLRSWLAWLAGRQTDVLTAGRVHVDLWVRGQQDAARSRRASGGGLTAPRHLLSRIPVILPSRS